MPRGVIGSMVLTALGLLGLSLAISGVFGANPRLAGGIVATLMLISGLVGLMRRG